MSAPGALSQVTDPVGFFPTVFESVRALICQLCWPQSEPAADNGPAIL